MHACRHAICLIFSCKLEASLIDVESCQTISKRKIDGLADRYCIILCKIILALNTHVHRDRASWASM